MVRVPKRVAGLLLAPVMLAAMLTSITAAPAGAVAGAASTVFINEIHYDNTGADSGEAVEVAGPAGTDLSGWSLVAYNGSNGQTYDTEVLSGVLADQQGGYGTASFPIAGLQNGAPDGIALVDPSSTVVQFLSYEGTFAAVNGPASGQTSTDIGVTEASSSPVGNSLQATGVGSTAGDFTFAPSQPNTFGSPNVGQTFDGGGGSPGVLVVSEIMFNPASAEDDNEWVEVANTGGSAIDLAGYVIDDNNSVSHPSANIAAGVVPAGGSAVLYNADDLTDAQFAANWGPGINLVAVTNWSALALNNGGDTLGIWTDFASYSGDHQTQANALISFAYDGSLDDGTGSIFLTDLAADPAVFANWALSTDGATTPVFDAYPSNGGSIGSPGPTPPDPIVEIGVCGDPATLIHAIQGSGTASPLVGETHVVEGVVVGHFPGTGGLRGFFVQEEDADADADPATSEGIFVFDGAGTAPVAVGDQIRVLGDVLEFFDLTEISLDELLVCPPGAPAPAPTDLTLPRAPGTDYESVEGMRIRFPGELVVTETFSGFEDGEISLAPAVLPNPTEVAAPGGPANAQNDLNDRSRVLLNDGADGGANRNRECVDLTAGLDAGGFLSSPPQTTRIGDSITDLVGVMNFSFGDFKVEPTGADPCDPDFFTRTAASARPTGPPAVGGSLQVASFNVLNYFLTIDDGVNDARGADSAVELQRQKDKIVDAIVDLDADIVGLIELENDAASAPAADLAAATGLSFVNTGLVGTDAIVVGFLYDPATVTPVGPPAVLDSSVDPLFNDDKNRPALLQTFEENATGARVNVVVNHFKSKGSPCNDVGDPDAGDQQGNCNGVRTDAATALANWLNTTYAGENNLVMGDLNAYSLEDPIVAFENAGFTDLVDSLGGNAPSFVFRGEVGRLDHALANAELLAQVAGAGVWAINMEEPRYLDYNDDVLDAGENPFASSGDPNPVQLYVADEFRSSDHNPVLVGLNLTPPGPTCNGLAATIVGTPGRDRLRGTPGDDVIVALGGNDEVWGRGGNDTICLGAGRDWADGGNGNDVIFGEDGRDDIRGGNGDDLIDGGDGRDELRGNGGIDTIVGGDGNDWIRGGGQADDIDGGDGRDWISGDGGGDTIAGGEDRDDIRGGNGADVIDAGPGNDDVRGQAGDDVIDGGDGTDDVHGGSGFDTCTNAENVSGCEA